MSAIKAAAKQAILESETPPSPSFCVNRMGLNWVDASSFFKKVSRLINPALRRSKAPPEWSPIGRHETILNSKCLFLLIFFW